MTAPASAFDPVAIADWRRRVAQMYADVRRIAATDPAAAHGVWVQQRDELFATHPASPLDVVASASFAGLDVAPYDPAYRFEVASSPPASSGWTSRPRPTASCRSSASGPSQLGVARVVGRLGAQVVRAAGCSSRCATPLAGTSTYGGGRYVLDTVKGADHGWPATGSSST